MRRWATLGAAVLAAATLAAGQTMDLPRGLARGLELSEAAKTFELRAVPSHTQVAPGQTFHVALQANLAEGWVYYGPDPGPIVLPGGLDVQAEGLQAGPALWPRDEAKETDYGEGPVVNHVYKHAFVLYAALTAPPDLAAGEYTVTLSPRGQICLQVCINLEGRDAVSASTSVKVAPEAVANPAWTAELAAGLRTAMTAAKLKESHAAAAKPPEPAKAAAPGAVSAEVKDYSLWAGLGLAVLAGLSLNIMPCVLPIIPLRIYSIVQMAGASRRRFVTLGLAFAAGIVLFFVGLAGANVVLRLLGRHTLDLNQHFQVAWVRILIAMVLLALSANLWGLFNVTVPTKVAGIGQDGKAQGHLPAVGMGLMMAVLSTPCSFWLMALALAWAQLQPLWLGTVVIVLIGVGMAVPHAILAALPDLVKKLPRPGRWMEYFKQTMGFLLLPAVLYLLSTLSLPDWPAYPFWVAAFGAVLVFALWVWGSWVRYDAPLGRKLAVRGFAVALTVAAGFWMLPEPAPPLVKFEPFSAERIAQARRDGDIVLVKVTAAWCTECKLLDYEVFNTPETARQFERFRVVPVKADVTDRGSPAYQWVAKNFGGAPPLTIIYPTDGGPPKQIVGRFPREQLYEDLAKAKAN